MSQPIPAAVTCEWCTGEARRTWRTAGLSGTSKMPSSDASPIDISCRANPDIPALCHLTPDARRRLIAKARGDNRSLEREIERQETHVKDHGGKPLAEVMSHDHSHGHVHASEAGSAGTHAHAPTPSTPVASVATP